MITADQVEKIIAPKLEGTDLFIVNVQVSTNNQIKVEVDGDNGLPIEACVMVSRHIEQQLDREEEDYELSVTSPGLDQPLQLLRQYKKNVGRSLKVVRTGADKKVTGELIAADEEGITLRTERKQRIPGKKKKEKIIEDIQLNFNEIESAKVIISFK